jgi:hypothetical protein
MRHSIWSCAYRLIVEWRPLCQPFLDAKPFHQSCPCGPPRTCFFQVSLSFELFRLAYSRVTFVHCFAKPVALNESVSLQSHHLTYLVR